ncbi:hypothetical protein D4764_0154780 [Takifugu flavidus]|uniref:Uncharacterized protein n=1 Tax=Takifugu flavidus TaxID=433684 RepID=A0A5C6MHY5_9TELE|nr:hypothetical protein D4764_0154780 [Takifugu flavidus]
MFTNTLLLEDDDESGTDEAIGGYDPAIKRVLAKAEKRGNKSKKKAKSGQDLTDDSSGQQREEAQQRLDEQRGTTVQPGDKVFVKVFRRKWFDERRQGPYEVAQSEVTPRAQPHLLENSVEHEAGGQENPEGLHQVEDVVAAVEPPSVGVGNDIPEPQQGQNFNVIDFNTSQTGSHQNFLQELLRKSQRGKTKGKGSLGRERYKEPVGPWYLSLGGCIA